MTNNQYPVTNEPHSINWILVIGYWLFAVGTSGSTWNLKDA